MVWVNIANAIKIIINALEITTVFSFTPQRAAYKIFNRFIKFFYPFSAPLFDYFPVMRHQLV
jgi:hypothetical protein